MSGRLDTHVHFWDPAVRAPRWLSPGHLLHRRFEPRDVEPGASACGVTGAIAVQADDCVEDSLDLLRLAAATPWIAGVVGWVDVHGDVPRQLDRLRAAPGGENLVGVRIALSGASGGWYRSDDVATADALACVAGAGLALDVLADAATLWAVAEIADRLPHLPLVLDHLGQPRAGSYPRWRDELTRAAELPNVVAKVSGLTTALPDSHLRAAAVAHGLRVLGADRLMFGSDWPVSVLATTYCETVACYEQLLADHRPTWADTARAVYLRRR
jgi:L-fuconolactonase